MNTGIVLENVSFCYTSKNQQLEALSLHIPQGSFFGISGVNGSGKTTLSLLFNGLIPNEISGKLTGNVIVDGTNTKTKPVSFFAQKVGMLFQNPDFMLFNLTVAEEIAFGLKNSNNVNAKNYAQKITNALKMVGLEGYEQRDPQTLSLGEKQKVCLASVLALDTNYIVLDEPVAMLDYKGAVNLYKTLDVLNKNYGKTIIVIEHDTDFLHAHAHKTIILDKGKIILEGKTKEVFAQTKKLQELGIKIPQPIV
jgi:energy-coupling factor transport system ATP-binding protein